MADCLGLLPKKLINECGGDFGFVCIWRKDSKESAARRMTVGEFLSMPENQSGTWLIDGGWGGPPGPIHVRWNGEQWENGGYCGARWSGEADHKDESAAQDEHVYFHGGRYHGRTFSLAKADKIELFVFQGSAMMARYFPEIATPDDMGWRYRRTRIKDRDGQTMFMLAQQDEG